VIEFGRDICGDFEQACRREWLVTNGIGGFASGTIALANTRRYHGLLIASLQPPVARTLMVAQLGALAYYRDRQYDLVSNEFADGTVHPRGYLQIESFALDGRIPTWRFALGDALLEQRIFMAQGSNTTYVEFRLPRAAQPVGLELRPLCALRDYRWQQRGRRDFAVESLDGGVRIAQPGAAPASRPAYRILAERGGFEAAPEWHWNFRHRAESARGLDDLEDLFTPGRFTLALAPGGSVALALTAEDGPPAAAARIYSLARRAEADLLHGLATDAPDWVRQLTLAADQFLVARQGDDGARGTTVIAGYPWFTDWGRDTMIALPGLALATRRFETAADILRTFARHVDRGLLPNRFPDGGEPAEYNTVDATLWYFLAVDEYTRASGDAALADELYPILSTIVDFHVAGTRHGIQVDPRDGLLAAGEPGVQLTWMDAKVGDWVVTPRIGKPVEINALWINALAILGRLSRKRNDSARARALQGMVERARASFARRFWSARDGHLFDVIDTPEGRDDPSLRPNQLIAISLPEALLTDDQARAVVDACAALLLTSAGLRSLAPSDPRYAGRYGGGPHERDAAYHQGTVWSWLLGPFAIAHYRAHGDARTARSFLEPVALHLADACLGNVSEIFAGDAPHRPEGCFAQAWGVSETLRAWHFLTSELQSDRPMRSSQGRPSTRQTRDTPETRTS
jgi:predicted glycogen debranching enzyme